MEASAFAFCQQGNLLTFSLSSGESGMCLWIRRKLPDLHASSKDLGLCKCVQLVMYSAIKARFHFLQQETSLPGNRQQCQCMSGCINIKYPLFLLHLCSISTGIFPFSPSKMLLCIVAECFELLYLEVYFTTMSTFVSWDVIFQKPLEST